MIFSARVATESPTYLAAFPFMVSILILWVGQGFGTYVGQRLEETIGSQLREANARSGGTLEQILPIRLTPGPLRQRFEWGMDSIQAATILVAPLLGLIFAVPSGVWQGHNLVFLLAVTWFANLGLLVRILGMEPGRYQSRALNIRGLTVSLVTAWGTVSNGVAALIVITVAGPPSVEAFPWFSV